MIGIVFLAALLLLFVAALCKTASKSKWEDEYPDDGDGCTPDKEDE